MQALGSRSVISGASTSGIQARQQRVSVCGTRVARPVQTTSRHIRRRNVCVEANLFSRVARVIQSTATNLVSQAEDPEKILDQVVTEMQEDLIKVRQATAQVMASQKQLEAKNKQAQDTADEWLRRAELAVSKGEEDLAREALKRRKTYQETATSLKTQLDGQQKALDQLIANSRTLEAKLSEAKLKKDTLKARAASAKTSKQINEMVGSLNTSNAFVAFDKMEEKVLAMEAEAESVTMLTSGGSALENKFAALESGTVDDELAALKRGVLGDKKPVAALPEGRPIKDAIDDELEALRRKARE